MKDLDIGEVAQRSGVPASTLRFYEDKGLIASAVRSTLKAASAGKVGAKKKRVAPSRS